MADVPRHKIMITCCWLQSVTKVLRAFPQLMKMNCYKKQREWKKNIFL